ncbi:hypothetical protein COT50_03035, partial [candidate division WWE3 bacterium CG08_land_8_20_14_0_20_41_10]
TGATNPAAALTAQAISLTGGSTSYAQTGIDITINGQGTTSGALKGLVFAVSGGTSTMYDIYGTSGTWYVSNAGVLGFSGDGVLKLGDALGAYAFKIKDSGDTSLFTVDSLGNLTVDGKTAVFNLTPTGNTDVFTINRGGTGTGFAFRVNDGGTGDTSPFIISSSGNVGIGTTAPATGAKLHVEGQCVTGDTLLPVVSKSATEFVQIKDIKGGEYVLSLNEDTGKIVPAKINGLLDMGVKPVFKLTTEDGRSIRTTGNHPYLVKQNLFEESEVKQEQSDDRQSESDGRPDINIEDIDFIVHNNLLKTNAKPKQNIPSSVSTVKTSVFSNPLLAEKLGTIITAPNQPADKLTNNSEKIVNQRGSNFIGNNLPNNDAPVNASWTKVIYLKEGDEIAVANNNLLLGFGTQGGISHNSNSQQNQSSNSIKSPQPVEIHDSAPLSKNKLTATQPNIGIRPNSITDKFTLSTPVNNGVIAEAKNTRPKLAVNSDNLSSWESFNNTNTGVQNVSSDIIWTKIASIEYVGEEQVYDIEVEGTHNFVGNGIVAHNTYIKGA